MSVEKERNKMKRGRNIIAAANREYLLLKLKRCRIRDSTSNVVDRRRVGDEVGGTPFWWCFLSFCSIRCSRSSSSSDESLSIGCLLCFLGYSVGQCRLVGLR